MTHERAGVSRTLRVGVAVSFAFLVLGLLRALTDTPVALLDPGISAELFAEAATGDASALIHLGLLALMVTPLLRVGVLISHFLRARERTFALIAIGVLCLLVVSIAVGLTQGG